MGQNPRRSFIDDVSKSDFTPGPGNYRMPHNSLIIGSHDFLRLEFMSLFILLSVNPF